MNDELKEIHKCPHYDTHVLLYFYGTKSINDLQRGDIVMGNNYKPQIVMHTSTEAQCLYKITPDIGESFIIGGRQPLILYNELNRKVTKILISDYMLKDPIWKKVYELFYIPIEYTQQKTNNDPYLIGLLLGAHGNSIESVFKEYISTTNYNTTHYNTTSNLFNWQNLERLDTIDRDELNQIFRAKNKLIPITYLYNSRSIRHSLLKGFTKVNKSANLKRMKRSRSAERHNAKRYSVEKNLCEKRKQNSYIEFDGKQNPYIDLCTFKLMYNKNRNKSGLRAFANAILPVNKTTSVASSAVVAQKNRKISKQRYTQTTLACIDNIDLLKQIKFLIRSLGYICIQTDNILTIIGNLDVLPPLTQKIGTKFGVTEIGVEQYNKITLNDSTRLILGNGLVIHS